MIAIPIIGFNNAPAVAYRPHVLVLICAGNLRLVLARKQSWLIWSRTSRRGKVYEARAFVNELSTISVPRHVLL